MPRFAPLLFLICPLLGGCADLAKPTPIRITKETPTTTMVIPPGGSRTPKVLRLNGGAPPSRPAARVPRPPAGTG